MKIFIWNNIDDLTGNYHSSGAAIVIEENIEKAKQKLGKNEEPDYVFEIQAQEPMIEIYPNAGCC